MKKFFLILTLAGSFLNAEGQFMALYDASADQFIPYRFVPMERRNVSPDCEERTTMYPVFETQRKYANIKTANDNISRMYQFYMSDSFVNELQKRFHEIVLNYQENFPDQLNCVNDQKVYAVNFTTMEVSIVSCHNGVVMILNSLFYTVANAPVTQIQNNMYNEILQIDLNKGTLTRNPSLIIKDKQVAFTELVRRRLDIYLENFRLRGGTFNELLELSNESTQRYDDYKYEETNIEEYNEDGQLINSELPVYPTEPGAPEAAKIFSKPRRTGVDSAVNLIRYKDLMVYWKNFSVFVRVSPYADMAAYIPNGIIEIDFSWNELAPFLVSSPASIFNKKIELTEELWKRYLSEPDLQPRIPFYFYNNYNDPQNITGYRKVSVSEIHQPGGAYQNNQRRELQYDDSGRLISAMYYLAQDSIPNIKLKYIYKDGKLLQKIQYDRTGNVSNVFPAAAISIGNKENAYYLVRIEDQGYSEYVYGTAGEFKVYVLDGRLIIEPQAPAYRSEDDYSYYNYARIIRFDSAERRITDFTLNENASVEAIMTKDEIVPVLRKYIYDNSGKLLSGGDFLAEYGMDRITFLASISGNWSSEYSYDELGRVKEVIMKSNGSVHKMIRVEYHESSIYPDNIEIYEPDNARVVNYKVTFN